jgi:serine/threonine-protein kinase HipA
MRSANVYYRQELSGTLSKDAQGYCFEYAPAYHRNAALPAISLSLPKQESAFRSKILFPFFFGLLAEGENKAIQCRVFKIDENDHFTRLLKTCATETIGGITVAEVP